MNCKIFRSTDSDELEKKINEWLKGKYISLLSVTQSTDSNSSRTTVTVFYQTQWPGTPVEEVTF